MMTNDDVLKKLDELIAATKVIAIPMDARWLDAEGVAAQLSYKPRYVAETLAALPGFPKPLRVDGDGHPRWLASEIDQWAKAQREAHNGRPRGKKKTETATAEI